MKQQLHYSMVIEWSDEDDAFIVTVPELPGCITHGETYEEAARQGEEVIEGWIEAAQADGQPIPEPDTFTYWSPFHYGVEANAAQDSSAKG